MQKIEGGQLVLLIMRKLLYKIHNFIKIEFSLINHWISVKKIANIF